MDSTSPSSYKAHKQLTLIQGHVTWPYIAPMLQCPVSYGALGAPGPQLGVSEDTNACEPIC